MSSIYPVTNFINFTEKIKVAVMLINFPITEQIL